MPNEPRRRPRSEPIGKPWIWIGLVVILLVGIPWYLPPGTIQPIVLGLPLWTWVAIGSSVLLCGYLTWVVTRHWNLVEDDEEARTDAAGPAGSANPAAGEDA